MLFKRERNLKLMNYFCNFPFNICTGSLWVTETLEREILGKGNYSIRLYNQQRLVRENCNVKEKSPGLEIMECSCRLSIYIKS